MRIKCPYCGERDTQEFACLGPAALKHRPDPAAVDAEQRFYDYAYLRDNPAGPLAELWYHASGCHSWLRVVRDTRTHVIQEVSFASEPAEDAG